MYIDSEVQGTRPLDSRSGREEAVYDLLESLGVSFERVDHDPTASVELCEVVEKVLDIHICKNLFLSNRQGTSFYLLLMRGRKEFRTKDLSAQLGTSRLSFGKPEFMMTYLNTKPGSASVLGLMHDVGRQVQLVIDQDVLEDEYIGCHPCENTTSLKIRTSDLLEKILPAVKHEAILVDL